MNEKIKQLIDEAEMQKELIDQLKRNITQAETAKKNSINDLGKLLGNKMKGGDEIVFFIEEETYKLSVRNNEFELSRYQTNGFYGI